MKENEEKAGSIAEQKRKIRERYKGISEDELDVIPAIPREDFYKGESEKRVAVYARVSTDDPRQTSSYELQRNHYQDVVNRRPNWKLIEIYADEGISGTSLKHRDSFLRMIEDCKAGKIDLILTKSVSRFARNILDCIGYVRELKAMQPPIGIFFETENIYTLNENSEMSLSFIATLAQEESHTKSEIMNASIEMRFKRGIFLTPPLLGYDQDEEGNLVINEEEAKTVQLVFFMYLYGYTCQQIAETLTLLKRRTKKGNTTWTSGGVLQVLQNERHCGDVLARKTWTPSYLDHKSKKNRQDRNQYRQKNHHEAIISRDDFIAVQRLISNAKYGNKAILPELQVITEGVLRGYVPVNPRWSGFKANDYREASDSIYDEIMQIPSKSIEVEAQSGDFDLRGYEIARAEFFDTMNRICITFSNDSIKFSTLAVRKLEKTHHIEMLIHPSKLQIAIRPCTTDNRNNMQWSRMNNGMKVPRPISGNAFLPTIFDLFGWNPDCKYRVIGLHRQKGNDGILLFDLHDVEVLMPPEAFTPTEEITPLTSKGKHKNVLAYPATWASNFGKNYYVHAQAKEMESEAEWNVNVEGTAYKESDIQPTAADEIEKNIHEILTDMKQEAENERTTDE